MGISFHLFFFPWWKWASICLTILFVKVKLSPKCNRGFHCDWIWVKHLCKSIIMTKEALLGFTVVSFSGKLIFNAVQGHSVTSINIAIFKTKRRLDATWNFSSITRVSTHEREHWEHCLCMKSLLKGRLLDNSPLELDLRQKVSIPEYDLTGRRVMVDLLPIRSHSGIETFCLPWRRGTGGATANMSCPKTFFFVNLVNFSTQTMF